MTPQMLDKQSGNEVAACRVYNTANQNLAVNVNNLLTWNAELFDTDNMHDNAVNPSRITIRTAGVYVCNLTAEWATNPTGVRTLFMAINGGFSTIPAWDGRNSQGSNGPTRHGCTLLWQFAVNDYVEAYAAQESGGTLALNGGVGQYLSMFSAARI